jgi:hypothetical protein
MLNIISMLLYYFVRPININKVAEKILNNKTRYPYFKDYISTVNNTFIHAYIKRTKQKLY